MKRNVMMRAHQIAKGLEGDYRARMSLALRQAWKEVKGLKSLEVGKNYGDIFGLPEEKKMIYAGGNTWKAVWGDKEMIKESPETTQKALEYINRPSYGTGIKA